MRTHLIWAAGTLPLANLIHALVPAPDHYHHEAIAGPIMGTILTVSAIVAFVGLLRRQSWAPTLAAVTGIATIAGFALFHALPFETEVTEPYWGEGVTNAPQVLSLVAVVAAAVWLVNEASAALRARRGTANVAHR